MRVDTLTGLLAPSALLARVPGSGGTGIVFDIVEMIRVNDASDHVQGDAVIRAVAAALSGLAHAPGDALLRIGGEEFLWIPGPGRTEDAVTLAAAGQAHVGALELLVAPSPFAIRRVELSATVLTLRAGETAPALRDRAAEAVWQERQRVGRRGPVLVDTRKRR